MGSVISSKERILAAIRYQDVDHIPLSFMIFTALKERLKLKHGRFDPLKMVEAQLELGLDAMVDLRTFAPENKMTGHADAPGFPVHFHNSVKVYEWTEIKGEGKNPVLFKKYETPAGELDVIVNQTTDWPYTNASSGEVIVPFMDDYLAPRSQKFLVNDRSNLKALTYLLQHPNEREIMECRKAWDMGKKLAHKHNLLLAGGWGVGGDALAWLCGLQNAVLMALIDPDLLREILLSIHNWNMERMKIYLDYGIDLFIRRAWYEGTDFWSPELFKEFFVPAIKEEVNMAHEAGVMYGYILTSGSAPLHDMLIDVGIDVLIGVDPVQGKGTDLRNFKIDLDEQLCAWGGVNGFITIERGDQKGIEKAVVEAIDTLGPKGFILSPVDNVRDPSDEVWKRVMMLINTWKKYCRIK